nr:hypothetical protein [uncultured Oscillibacter sp.]
MSKTKRNYIPFIAGMATVILLACLISASLAKEDPPAAQPQAEPQVQVQAGDLRLACSEAGVALFGVERTAPGEKLKAENGAEIPAVLTYTDEKGEAHYYVEAETIGDILDVCYGVNYHKEINCVDFGAKPRLDEKGEVRLTPSGEPMWFAGDVECDIDYALSMRDGKKTGFSTAMGAEFTTSSGVTISNGGTPELSAEERAEKEQIWEEQRQEAPLKPEYGVKGGMYTEVDPAEVDLDSWSGTAMKKQKFQGDKENNIEQSFAFTPYLGEYAVITIENTGTEDASVFISRPNTVGNRRADAYFTNGVRVPAGGKLVRAFRIDPELPLENRLNLRASAFTDREAELTLTAEQYRFGK